MLAPLLRLGRELHSPKGSRSSRGGCSGRARGVRSVRQKTKEAKAINEVTISISQTAFPNKYHLPLFLPCLRAGFCSLVGKRCKATFNWWQPLETDLRKLKEILQFVLNIWPHIHIISYITGLNNEVLAPFLSGLLPAMLLLYTTS